MYCRNCGTNNELDSKFCYHCGNKLVPMINCPHCGKEILKKDKYCCYCGERKYFHKPSKLFKVLNIILIILLLAGFVSSGFMQVTQYNRYIILFEYWTSWSSECLAIYLISSILLVLLAIFYIFLEHFPRILKRILYILSLIILFIFVSMFIILSIQIYNQASGIIYLTICSCITLIELYKIHSCIIKDIRKKL